MYLKRSHPSQKKPQNKQAVCDIAQTHTWLPLSEQSCVKPELNIKWHPAHCHCIQTADPRLKVLWWSAQERQMKMNPGCDTEEGHQSLPSPPLFWSQGFYRNICFHSHQIQQQQQFPWPPSLRHWWLIRSVEITDQKEKTLWVEGWQEQCLRYFGFFCFLRFHIKT